MDHVRRPLAVSFTEFKIASGVRLDQKVILIESPIKLILIIIAPINWHLNVIAVAGEILKQLLVF